MRIAILRDTGRKLGGVLGFNRGFHSVPQSPPLSGCIDHGIQSVQPVLPEFSFPSFSFGGSMELMAVPKRKVKYLHNFSVILDFLLFVLNFTDAFFKEKLCECNDLYSIDFFNFGFCYFRDDFVCLVGFSS